MSNGSNNSNNLKASDENGGNNKRNISSSTGSEKSNRWSMLPAAVASRMALSFVGVPVPLDGADAVRKRLISNRMSLLRQETKNRLEKHQKIREVKEQLTQKQRQNKLIQRREIQAKLNRLKDEAFSSTNNLISEKISKSTTCNNVGDRIEHPVCVSATNTPSSRRPQAFHNHQNTRNISVNGQLSTQAKSHIQNNINILGASRWSESLDTADADEDEQQALLQQLILVEIAAMQDDQANIDVRAVGTSSGINVTAPSARKHQPRAFPPIKTSTNCNKIQQYHQSRKMYTPFYSDNTTPGKHHHSAATKNTINVVPSGQRRTSVTGNACTVEGRTQKQNKRQDFNMHGNMGSTSRSSSVNSKGNNQYLGFRGPSSTENFPGSNILTTGARIRKGSSGINYVLKDIEYNKTRTDFMHNREASNYMGALAEAKVGNRQEFTTYMGTAHTFMQHDHCLGSCSVDNITENYCKNSTGNIRRPHSPCDQSLPQSVPTAVTATTHSPNANKQGRNTGTLFPHERLKPEIEEGDHLQENGEEHFLRTELQRYDFNDKKLENFPVKGTEDNRFNLSTRLQISSSTECCSSQSRSTISETPKSLLPTSYLENGKIKAINSNIIGPNSRRITEEGYAQKYECMQNCRAKENCKKRTKETYKSPGNDTHSHFTASPANSNDFSKKRPKKPLATAASIAAPTTKIREDPHSGAPFSADKSEASYPSKSNNADRISMSEGKEDAQDWRVEVVDRFLKKRIEMQLIAPRNDKPSQGSDNRRTCNYNGTENIASTANHDSRSCQDGCSPNKIDDESCTEEAEGIVARGIITERADTRSNPQKTGEGSAKAGSGNEYNSESRNCRNEANNRRKKKQVDPHDSVKGDNDIILFCSPKSGTGEKTPIGFGVSDINKEIHSLPYIKDSCGRENPKAEILTLPAALPPSSPSSMPAPSSAPTPLAFSPSVIYKQMQGISGSHSVCAPVRPKREELSPILDKASECGDVGTFELLESVESITLSSVQKKGEIHREDKRNASLREIEAAEEEEKKKLLLMGLNNQLLEIEAHVDNIKEQHKSEQHHSSYSAQRYQIMPLPKSRQTHPEAGNIKAWNKFALGHTEEKNIHLQYTDKGIVKSSCNGSAKKTYLELQEISELRKHQQIEKRKTKREKQLSQELLLRGELLLCTETTPGSIRPMPVACTTEDDVKRQDGDDTTQHKAPPTPQHDGSLDKEPDNESVAKGQKESVELALNCIGRQHSHEPFCHQEMQYTQNAFPQAIDQSESPNKEEKKETAKQQLLMLQQQKGPFSEQQLLLLLQNTLVQDRLKTLVGQLLQLVRKKQKPFTMPS